MLFRLLVLVVRGSVVTLSDIAYNVKALYRRAFGGKDKLNRIVRVSILLPYLLLNNAFSVRNNQC